MYVTRNHDRPTDAPRALIVDDDELVSGTIAAQLSNLGWAVETTGNAAEFLAAVSRKDACFDLAIVDVNLPGLVGTEVITWIRKSDVEEIRLLPVLVVTGCPWKVPDDFCEAQGRCNLLAKPFTLASLAQRIEALAKPAPCPRLRSRLH
jgi:DNA-binding response OmpR family regulator